MGDPIEFSAIKSVFLAGDPSAVASTQPLVLGAVKTNIGHLEGAAGMAGLIKTIMSLIHKSCPPNIHLDTLNPAIDTAASIRHVMFPHRVTPLITSESSMDTDTLIAGVSSFGSGGTNSHVIVQSHSHTTSASFYVEDPEEKFESRTRAKSRSDSIDNILITTTSKVVFLITGQGSSADLLTKSIGAGLFRSEPVFERVFTECSEAFEISKKRLGICERNMANPENNLSLVDVLLQTKSHIKITNVALYTQCILYSLTVSMAELWESRGVQPDVLLGHSLGEYTVATVADILSIDDGMLMVALRADSIANTDDSNNHSPHRKGIMVALRTSADEATAVISKLFPDNRTLEEGMFAPIVSVVNGPASCVVSGHAVFVNEVAQTLNCSHKELVVTNAFHSPLMYKAAQVFREKAQEFMESGHIEFNNPKKNIVSSVTGKCAKDNDMICLDYWVNHITNPVIFYDSLLTLFGNRKSDKPIFPDICIVTEIGPGETLTKLVKPVNIGAIIPQQRKIQWVMSFSGSNVKKSFVSDPTEQEFFQQHSSRALLELKIHQLKRKFKGGNWSQTEIHRWRYKGKDVSIYNTVKDKNVLDNQQKSIVSTVVNRETMVQVIKNILTDVLLHSVDIDDVDEHTSLVSLGVDSLGAIQIKNQLSLEFGNVPLLSTLVFDYPSISSICEHINSQLLNASPPETTSEEEVVEISPQMLEYTANNLDIEAAFVTTQMQQAMLFYHLSQPESCTFIETFSWIIEHKSNVPLSTTYRFDREAFRAAWVSTVLTHSSLRSSFDMEVVPPVQKVRTKKAVQSFLESETSNWFEYVRAPMHIKTDANCAAIVKMKTQEQRSHGGIDPSSELLFKLSLIELVDHSSQSQECPDYLIVLTLHHAIVDGYSMPSILKTLTDNYTSSFTQQDASSSKNTSLGRLVSSSFELFSRYEHELLESSNSKDPVKHYRLLQLQNYWRNLMQGWSGCNEFSNMPVAVINTADAEVLRCQHPVAASTAARCQLAAREANVTLASLVHAAWCIVFKLSVACLESNNSSDLSASNHRTSSDILYGCTATGRSAPVSHLSEVVGPVINTFPVRIQSSVHTKAYPAVEFVRKVHDQLVSSVNCETLPLPEIQRLATTHTRSIFPIIVDYQHDALFHCNFEEVSQLHMRHLALVDRIGCPLSVRIIVGQEELKSPKSGKAVTLKLISTSECLEYDMEFLENILTVFEGSLHLVSSLILDDKESQNDESCSLFNLEAALLKQFPNFLPFQQQAAAAGDSDSSGTVVGSRKGTALPPPAIPTSPASVTRVSLQHSLLSCQKTISALDMKRIVENVHCFFKPSLPDDISTMQCLQLMFMLVLNRWSSNSSFSVGHQDGTGPIASLLFESKDAATSSFAWEDVTFQSLVEHYLPLSVSSASPTEAPSILFQDCTCDQRATAALSGSNSVNRPKLFMVCIHTAGGSGAQFAGWGNQCTRSV